MSTYVIGDVQACLTPLKKLLALLNYNPEQDTLWFTGDLVNRGPDSLKTLRFVKSLGENIVVVLGNHDLSLLAASEGLYTPRPTDTIQEILEAPDKHELCHWLRYRSLLHQDEKLGFVLVHAGIPPQWSLEEALRYAREVEELLRGEAYHEFLRHLFGNMPAQWDNALLGWERARYIINAFTRLRFCKSDGTLNLTVKGPLSHAPLGYMPWFNIPNRATGSQKIIFGHWAALVGVCEAKNVIALDTGCVWGNSLTAICLETQKKTQVSCHVK